MKDCFSNSEGISDLAKPLFIHELVREHILDLFSMLLVLSRSVDRRRGESLGESLSCNPISVVRVSVAFLKGFVA